MASLSTLFAVSLVSQSHAFIQTNAISNHTDIIPNDLSNPIQDIQLDIDPNLNLMQKLWLSIGDTVSSDLEYLKSLTASPECHEKIETEYLQNILYPVIHKTEPFSYNLQNLCPIPNPLQSKRKSIGSNTNPAKVKSLRIVYLIIMYKNPSQVIRLISALNTSMDHFLIHIDAKSSSQVSTPIMNHAKSHSNIHIMEQQELTWGGYKMVEVELAAMKYALDLPFKFDFFYPLSESDYPLVPTSVIRGFMNKYRGKSMIKRPSQLPNDQQYTNIHTECDNKLFYVGTRPGMRQSKVKIYSSTVWAAYSYEFTKYLVTDTRIVPEYLSFFEGTATCDEKFFATVLMNSPLCDDYVPIDWHIWRLEFWPEKNTDPAILPCRLSESNLPFCGRGPIDIEPKHLPILQASPAMFARKFNVNPNHKSKSVKDLNGISKALDVIDTWRTNSRKTKKGKILKNYKVIKIEMDGECLTFDDHQDELFSDTCYDDDEMQIFIMECTGPVSMDKDTKCMQSAEEFGGLAMSQCQIRSIIWDRKRDLRDSVSRDECLSVVEPAPKVKESGMSLTMDKCRLDGYMQWWILDGCEIKYANPMLKYLKKQNQNLCIGVCDVEYGDNRPCVKTCKGTKAGSRNKSRLNIRVL